MESKRLYDGQLTRRDLFRGNFLRENSQETEVYDVPVIPIQPIFAKRNENTRATFEHDREDGFIKPASPWPEHIKKKVEGVSVLTIEDLYSRISTVRDVTYSTPLSPQQLIEANGNNPVYVVATDSSAQHMRDKDLGLALMKFYASLAFDWDDPERQEIKHRIEGRIRENIPESAIQYIAFAGLTVATRNLPLAAGGAYAVKRAYQLRGMVHEYLLTHLSKYVSPNTLDDISGLTKPLLASTKDIELQHSLMVRNLSQAYSYISTIDSEVKEPAVALYTIDNSAGDDDVWNNPEKQMRILKNSLFEILKLYRQECKENGTSLTPERLLDVSVKLQELFGGLAIWRISPELADSKYERQLSTHAIQRFIQPIHRELNPLMLSIIKNKVKEVFPEQFDRIHYSSYNGHSL